MTMHCQFESVGDHVRCVRCGCIRATERTKKCFGKPLIGDRIKQITSAVHIKQCGGCKRRQAWLNRKHAQLKGANE